MMNLGILSFMSELGFLDRNVLSAKLWIAIAVSRGEIKEILVNSGWKGWDGAKGSMDIKVAFRHLIRQKGSTELYPTWNYPHSPKRLGQNQKPD